MIRQEKEEEKKQRQQVSIWMYGDNYQIIGCLYFFYHLTYYFFQMQGKKKVQSQLVAEQHNIYAFRPGTSSRRLPDRSLNGGLDNAMPLSREHAVGIQQMRPNSINSGN